MSATKRRSVRVAVLMRPAAVDALAQLAAYWDANTTDAVNRAVSLAAVIEELRGGEPLKVVRPDGSIETVRFL